MTCQLGFPNAGNPLDPGAMPRGTRPRSVHKGPQGNSKDFLREIMDLGDSMSQCVDMFQVKKLELSPTSRRGRPHGPKPRMMQEKLAN